MSERCPDPRRRSSERGPGDPVLTPGTPLSLLHPQGGIGCNLLANPDSTLMLLPVGGSVVSQFGMPLDPAYAGVQVRNQVLQIELDPGFNITLIAGSNGLTLTIGAF